MILRTWECLDSVLLLFLHTFLHFTTHLERKQRGNRDEEDEDDARNASKWIYLLKIFVIEEEDEGEEEIENGVYVFALGELKRKKRECYRWGSGFTKDRRGK